jgi:hypothetical protein
LSLLDWIAKQQYKKGNKDGQIDIGPRVSAIKRYFMMAGLKS